MELQIHSGEITLPGLLTIPEGATGLVIFAHGSGSSRHSPRNRAVARFLNEHGLGTFLLDLLSPEEEAEDRFTGHLRFDIGLLAERLLMAMEWLQEQNAEPNLQIGLFGSSTGGAAALVAAAAKPQWTGAVVSRGGRPDLADPDLERVQAPTLLIVGGADEQVLLLNRKAAERLHCPHELSVIPAATHLFEEPGALEEVARRATRWFQRHL